MNDLGVERSAAGITILADLLPRFDEILTADALEFVADLTRRFGPRRAELLQARADRYRAGSPGASLAFRDDTAKIRTDPSWRVAPPAPGLEDRRCEMTGPDLAEDDHQRAELRRQGLDGRLRGCDGADLVQRGRRPDQPLRRHPPADRLHRREGQALRGGSGHPDRARPAARLAPRREAPDAGRPAGARRLRGFRSVLLPQRPDLDHRRGRTVLLPAQDGVPSGGPAVERRVQLRRGAAGDQLRQHPGNLPDRDHPRGLRDGGDPLRVARPLGGTERRAGGTTSSR